MRRLEAHKVDAFTDRPFGGNPAGVVPEAEGLSEAQMRAIAREMNLSETAFVLPATAPGADLRLRFFTPAAEVPLCGHATVATFHVLCETRRMVAPATVRVETGAGVLPVDVRRDGRIFLSSDPLRSSDAPLPAAEAARLLGLAPEDVAGPTRLVNGKWFVTVAGLKALEKAAPDFRALGDASRAHGFQGLAAVSFETGSDALTHLRYFAPAVGVDEDPVTGTAHLALGGWLLETGRVRAPARFKGEQGRSCGRPGVVEVEVDGPAAIRAGGRAVTTLSGELRLP